MGYTPPSTLAAGQLLTGEEVFSRMFASGSVTMSTGNLRLAYFTGRATATRTAVRLATAASGYSGGTPTLIRAGVFSVAANGTIILLAATANDTTLLAAGGTDYAKAFSGGNFSEVFGSRYAFGLLVVTSFTGPTVPGTAPSNSNGTEAATAPQLCGVVASQSDLPALNGTIAAGSIGTTANMIYGVLT